MPLTCSFLVGAYTTSATPPSPTGSTRKQTSNSSPNEQASHQSAQHSTPTATSTPTQTANSPTASNPHHTNAKGSRIYQTCRTARRASRPLSEDVRVCHPPGCPKDCQRVAPAATARCRSSDSWRRQRPSTRCMRRSAHRCETARRPCRPYQHRARRRSRSWSPPSVSLGSCRPTDMIAARCDNRRSGRRLALITPGPSAEFPILNRQLPPSLKAGSPQMEQTVWCSTAHHQDPTVQA